MRFPLIHIQILLPASKILWVGNHKYIPYVRENLVANEKYNCFINKLPKNTLIKNLVDNPRYFTVSFTFGYLQLAAC